MRIYFGSIKDKPGWTEQPEERKFVIICKNLTSHDEVKRMFYKHAGDPECYDMRTIKYSGDIELNFELQPQEIITRKFLNTYKEEECEGKFYWLDYFYDA